MCTMLGFTYIRLVFFLFTKNVKNVKHVRVDKKNKNSDFCTRLRGVGRQTTDYRLARCQPSDASKVSAVFSFCRHSLSGLEFK